MSPLIDYSCDCDHRITSGVGVGVGVGVAVVPATIFSNLSLAAGIDDITKPSAQAMETQAAPFTSSGIPPRNRCFPGGGSETCSDIAVAGATICERAAWIFRMSSVADTVEPSPPALSVSEISSLGTLDT